MNRFFSIASKHLIFIASFGALYGMFLWPLITLRRGFVLGDYSVQFYPWLHVYSQALQVGQLPLWTPLIQCGFPLFAEGQTGMLYLPNLLLFKFLPFKQAYNGLFLSHFLAAGIFTYIFGRKRDLSPQAATIAALAFTFGSAYGGCFYNIVAMRALVWFPIALYLIEKYLKKKKLLPLVILAFVQSQSWLAGFPQMAAYSAFFIAVYFMIRLFEQKNSRRSNLTGIGWFIGSMALAIFIALPQIWATLDWARQSTRVLYEKDFTMWGSVPPWCLTTVFMYSWGAFLRYKVYIGLWPILAVLLAGTEKKARVFWILAGLSVFFALGSFNPVNWLLVHLPIASLLRNPSKFLFFTAFFLSILAGYAFDRLSQVSFRRGATIVGAVLSGAFCVLIFAQNAGGLLLRFGRWYTDAFVLGKSFHHGSAEEYLQKINGILADVQQELNLANPFFWLPILLALLFIVCLYAERRGFRKGLLRGLFIPVLLVDLFIFGQFGYGTGFVGNAASFPALSSIEGLPKDGRWLDVSVGEEALFPPNRNLLTGHSQIGAYSPLLDKNYYLLTKDLGALDDSFGRTRFSPDFLGANRDLVNFLGVKYIAAPKTLLIEGFGPGTLLGDHRIYINDQVLDEFSLAVPRGYANVRVTHNSAMRAEVEAESEQDAILVRSQFYTKDWVVRIDGKAAKLERAGRAFQSVQIPKGGHRVEWLYAPVWFTIGRWFYIGGLLFIMIMILILGVFRVRGKLV